MKRISRLLTVLCVLAAGSFAAAQDSHVNGLIWKASSPTDTIYLVGSIHLGSKDMFPLPTVYETAYQKASALIVEVDLNSIDPGAMMTKLQGSGMYANGDSLYNHLTAATAAALKAFCTKNGLPPETMGIFKPWVVSMMVEVMPAMKGGGMKPELGIDEYFLQKAKADHKRVAEVESLDFQVNLLSSMPESEQIKQLASALGTQPAGAQTIGSIEKEWIQGDAEGIEKAMQTGVGDAYMTKKIVDDRNPHMADVAERFLKYNKTCLFVVGAGHLVGPTGIVELLKKRGYSVEQVLSTPIAPAPTNAAKTGSQN